MTEGKHEAVADATLVSDRFYDAAKFCSLVLFPAIAALYIGLAALWHWPHVKEVAGSIALIDTFLGALIQQKGKQFQRAVTNLRKAEEAERESTVLDGDLLVSESEGPYVALNVPIDHPEGIANKSEVRFKVKPVD